MQNSLSLWKENSITPLFPSFFQFFLRKITSPEKVIRPLNSIIEGKIGFRYEKELTYQDTIRDIKDQYGDRFIYISYVSREETNTSLRGRIPKDIGNGALEKEANIQMNPNNTHVMICGNPAMLKDTTVELKKIGLKKHRRSSPGHITTENYW